MFVNINDYTVVEERLVVVTDIIGRTRGFNNNMEKALNNLFLFHDFSLKG